MFIILADAELELVPEEMKGEDEIRSILKATGKENTLLDNSKMRSSIAKHYPKYINRMGFPHIAYIFTRLNEESILNETIKLDYAIHTKHDVIIEKDDLAGIGAGYTEFAERVEMLLQKKTVKRKLVEYVEEIGTPGNTAVLHPNGKSGLVVNDQFNYIIGGFPEGDFRSNLLTLRKFAIHDKEITVPSVLELLHFKLFETL
ncbi:MAG: hypothetical protein AAE975_04940 [Thermoplasmatales archaeon]|jgi:rRNA small subunit pseudouridine methyltransferase Nep1